jgi:NCAIR mutase (PurE)-related protein
MRPEEVKVLLSDLKSGTATMSEALQALQRSPIEDLGFAQLDTHRELRQGIPEAIYAEGKTPTQVVSIAERLIAATTSTVLATRVSDETAKALAERFPEAEHHPVARIVVIRPQELGTITGTVTVVSAGTSDLPVAEEAAITASALGANVERINDVGVAGLHRLLAVQDRLNDSDVIIVVAGMEGALASLVGGIAAAPVVAVPTSIGYGASFEGLAALLAMLNSCAAGVAVMNIDNGFGAAVFALRLLRSRSR